MVKRMRKGVGSTFPKNTPSDQRDPRRKKSKADLGEYLSAVMGDDRNPRKSVDAEDSWDTKEVELYESYYVTQDGEERVAYQVRNAQMDMPVATIALAQASSGATAISAPFDYVSSPSPRRVWRGIPTKIPTYYSARSKWAVGRDDMVVALRGLTPYEVFDATWKLVQQTRGQGIVIEVVDDAEELYASLNSAVADGDKRYFMVAILQRAIASGLLDRDDAIAALSDAGPRGRKERLRFKLPEIVGSVTPSTFSQSDIDEPGLERLLEMAERNAPLVGADFNMVEVAEIVNTVPALIREILRHQDYLSVVLSLYPCHDADHIELHRAGGTCGKQAMSGALELAETLGLDWKNLPRRLHSSPCICHEYEAKDWETWQETGKLPSESSTLRRDVEGPKALVTKSLPAGYFEPLNEQTRTRQNTQMAQIADLIGTRPLDTRAGRPRAKSDPDLTLANIFAGEINRRLIAPPGEQDAND